MENEFNETGKQTAVRARKYLVSLNQGFHEVGPNAKNQIKKRYNIEGGSYDLIQLPTQKSCDPLDRLDDNDLDELVLVEVKSSNRSLPQTLEGHFFSLQYSEQLAAQSLGARYIFAFVVIQKDSSAFHRVLRWQDIWANAKTLHMQWSIRLNAVDPTVLEKRDNK